jgi:hypothetical protein
MSFWTNARYEPLSRFRFSVIFDHGETFQDVVSVKVPEAEVNTSDYRLINHTFTIPGNVKWSDCEITYVDAGNSIHDRWQNFLEQGYRYPNIRGSGTVSKTGQITKGNSDIEIYQLDSAGNIVNRYKLKNAFIKSITFGEMDYSSDELVTATITLSVDWMEVGWNKLSRHTSEPNWKQYSDPAAIQAQRLAADSHYDVSRVAMGGDAVDNVIEMNIDMLSEEDIFADDADETKGGIDVATEQTDSNKENPTSASNTSTQDNVPEAKPPTADLAAPEAEKTDRQKLQEQADKKGKLDCTGYATEEECRKAAEEARQTLANRDSTTTKDRAADAFKDF